MPDTPAPGITVDARGEVLVEPNLARLSIGVQAIGATVAEARVHAASAAAAVIESLVSNGLAREDLQTGHFGVNPRYEYRPEGEPRLAGYEVTNTFDVRVRDLASLPRVIDGAINAGGDAIRIHGVDFSIEDRRAPEGRARELAMAAARDRATQLAQLAGVTLGKPVSIIEMPPGGWSPARIKSMEAASFDSAETPVEAGRVRVAVALTVTYAID